MQQTNRALGVFHVGRGQLGTEHVAAARREPVQPKTSETLPSRGLLRRRFPEERAWNMGVMLADADTRLTEEAVWMRSR